MLQPLDELFAVDVESIRSACRISSCTRRDAWHGAAILNWSISNALFTEGSDDEDAMTKARSRYLANASMACFLLVQTDLPEKYMSATAVYAMSNTELGLIFEALVHRGGQERFAGHVMGLYRTWVDSKVGSGYEVQLEDGSETWRENNVEEIAASDISSWIAEAELAGSQADDIAKIDAQIGLLEEGAQMDARDRGESLDSVCHEIEDFLGGINSMDIAGGSNSDSADDAQDGDCDNDSDNIHPNATATTATSSSPVKTPQQGRGRVPLSAIYTYISRPSEASPISTWVSVSLS